MEINYEWIKLIGILGVGLIVTIVGFRSQQKHLKEKNRIQGHYSDTKSNLTPKEEKAKTFIETYKSKFSEDAIKKSLKSIGLDDYEIENYIKKYY